MPPEFAAAVVGGGFFGCELAARLARSRSPVVLLEQAAALMTRASYHNQARVHNGYHYPRSLLTALRSRLSYPRFVTEYADCMQRRFHQIYAVPRKFSKVTARQFRELCHRIGAPCNPAPAGIRRLFCPALVEDVFVVEECVFDAVKLRGVVRAKLSAAGVQVRLNATVRRLAPGPAGTVALTCSTAAGDGVTTAGCVFVCTYAQTNTLLGASGLPALGLKHELTELALVEVPAALRELGVTVMCGPFFSCLPFPPRGLHSLSHVRYTPHFAWQEGAGQPLGPPPEARRRQSQFALMVRDAARFMPLLAEAKQFDSLWEIKTVLPQSETDDSRPILFQRDWGLANVHIVLGSKIDNVYDALDHVERLASPRRAA
jgi:glycine/D-amino acid oxidase-like deaminating enzyme